MQYQIIPVTPYEQNCSVVWCEKTREAAVIDPGGEIERILDFLDAEHLTLVRILVTHGHVDHAGGVVSLKAERAVPVEGPHQADAFWLEGLTEQSQRFGFPLARSFEPDHWLSDGDTVNFGEEKLEVIHCPGHTPGHVVFYHRANQIAFVGDVLFQGSIGRTDFPKGSLPDLLSSIRQKLFVLGDDVVFVPGHGPMSSFGDERRFNPYCGDPQTP